MQPAKLKTLCSVNYPYKFNELRALCRLRQLGQFSQCCNFEDRVQCMFVSLLCCDGRLQGKEMTEFELTVNCP